MNKYLRSISYLAVIIFSIITSNSFAGPGYVSRDCPVAGAKESISVDWNGVAGKGGQWFYTLSYHLRKDWREDIGWKWEKHESNFKGKWTHTWRSYAGQVGNWVKNDYYSGVYGVHHWWNPLTRATEVRRAFVTDCNLESWGYNNW